MTQHKYLAVFLAATTVLTGAAYAAERVATPSAQQTVDTDALRLSADGAAAFHDLRGARLAIFNANPDEAKTLVGKAQSALAKAKSDESVFTKAEADLHAPKTGKDTDPTPSTDASKPVAWLPIDGQLKLGEDFVATPQKSAAVTEANKSLAKGDQKEAVQKLKLAGIDVNVTMAVAPLEATVQDVDQASTLIGQGRYYEANAALKKAEDGVRYDMVDTFALPQQGARSTPTGKDATPPAKPAQKNG